MSENFSMSVVPNGADLKLAVQLRAPRCQRTSNKYVRGKEVGPDFAGV